MKIMIAFHIVTALGALFCWLAALILGITKKIKSHPAIGKIYLLLYFLVMGSGLYLAVYSFFHLEEMHPGRNLGFHRFKTIISTVTSLAITTSLFNGLACIKRKHFHSFTLLLNFFFMGIMSWSCFSLLPHFGLRVLVFVLIWYPSVLLFLTWYFQNKDSYKHHLGYHIMFMSLSGSSLFTTLVDGDGAKIMPQSWQETLFSESFTLLANIIPPLLSYAIPLGLLMVNKIKKGKLYQ